jgi:predicted nucleotidyltransferase
MSGIISRPAASAIVVIDEIGAATLTDIATVSGMAVSSIQRGVHALTEASVLRREWNRGPFSFAPGAPRSALREMADWALGPRLARDLKAAALASSQPDSSAPPTITNPHIRRAWPHAIRRIVSTYHPRRVVLFGSQATGEADAQSDVDLLVVFDRVTDRRERSIQIIGLLRDMPFAKDVLVAGPDELNHPMVGTALADALKTGVVVYER